MIHRYVEILDKYFGSVCELDIIFNFEKAYFVLDEYILAGLLQESSKKKVTKNLFFCQFLQLTSGSQRDRSGRPDARRRPRARGDSLDLRRIRPHITPLIPTTPCFRYYSRNYSFSSLPYSTFFIFLKFNGDTFCYCSNLTNTCRK